MRAWQLMDQALSSPSRGSALSLFVPRVGANHIELPCPAHDLAVLAHPLYARTYFHNKTFFKSSASTRESCLAVPGLVDRHEQEASRPQPVGRADRHALSIPGFLRIDSDSSAPPARGRRNQLWRGADASPHPEPNSTNIPRRPGIRKSAPALASGFSGPPP